MVKSYLQRPISQQALTNGGRKGDRAGIYAAIKRTEEGAGGYREGGPATQNMEVWRMTGNDNYLGPVTGGMGRSPSPRFWVSRVSGSRTKGEVLGIGPRTPFFRFFKTSSLSRL